MEFFRHCPQCGRRFHIILENRQLEHVEQEQPIGRVTHTIGGGPYGRRGFSLMEEDRPIIVYREEFQYSYKCKHCSHEWTEKKIKEVQEP